MHRLKEYPPVNWINGMKINKSHFIDQQKAVLYQQALGNSTFLNDQHYGLTPMPGGGAPQVYLTVDNTQHINIRIAACSAITRGGHIIHLTTEPGDTDAAFPVKVPELNIHLDELKEKNTTYYLVLCINPYHPVPAGRADPEEQPVRLPYTQPQYSISLVPEIATGNHPLGDFQVPIGKATVQDQAVTLQNDYIPPCTSINSHPLLQQHYAETGQFLGKMELNTLQIVQKIIQKNQQNELIEPIRKLSEQVLFYISAVYENYRQLVPFAQPVQLISVTTGLARTIKNSMDLYRGPIKEAMINYFTEWCNIRQGALEESVSSACNYRYDHMNIREGIAMSANLSALILQLFNSLAALDYIGKKREAGIFVKENLVTPEEEAAHKKGFFLAD